MSCQGCQNRHPNCWDTCEDYKADKAQRQAKKQYLEQFMRHNMDTRRAIIKIHDKQERKKR